MWDAPPFDKKPNERHGRIATGAEARLIKAGVSGILSSINQEEEFVRLNMTEDVGTAFETFPFQNMTVDQIVWYCSSMIASMLEENVPMTDVNVMSESFLYELIVRIESDLDEPDLWVEQAGKLLTDFVGKTSTEYDPITDEETEKEIPNTPAFCIEALKEWLWLEDDDFSRYEMQNRPNGDPLHLFMGTSTEYYNMAVSIPTEQQLKLAREYLERIAKEGCEILTEGEKK